MKKILTISFIILTISIFKSQAQDKEIPVYPKGYLDFNGGISFPTSDFGKSDYYDNKAGFAKRGVTLGVEGAYYFYKNLGVVVSLSFQDQGELTTADAQTLANGYNNDFGKDQTSVTGNNRYNNVTLLIGLQYSFLYKKFTLDLHVQAGLVKSYGTPDILAEFDNTTSNTPDLEQFSVGGKKLAYGGGINLRYSLTDGIDVGLRSNYINTEAFSIRNSGHNGPAGRLVTSLPFTFIQTAIGFTIKF